MTVRENSAMAVSSTERVRAHRARRRALLGPVPDLERRPPLLADAVEVTIAALDLGERDAAVAALARLYADSLDQAQDQALALRAFGPLLLKTLEALHATPSTRPRTPGPRRPGQLDRLRAEHQRAKAQRISGR